jgi:hypothetical protein
VEGECERELEMESEQILTKEKAGKGLDGLRPERPWDEADEANGFGLLTSSSISNLNSAKEIFFIIQKTCNGKPLAKELAVGLNCEDIESTNTFSRFFGSENLLATTNVPSDGRISNKTGASKVIRHPQYVLVIVGKDVTDSHYLFVSQYEAGEILSMIIKEGMSWTNGIVVLDIRTKRVFGGASAVDTGDICNQDQVRYKEVCSFESTKWGCVF